MRRPSLSFALTLALTSIACGGGAVSPGPATPPLDIGKANTPASGPQKAAAPPVATPDAAVLVRVRDPEHSVAEVLSLVSTLPIPAQFASATGILEVLVGQSLAEAVDLTQPIDFMVNHSPEGEAMSFAIKPSADAAVRKQAGVRELTEPTALPLDDAREMKHCIVAPGSGRVATRVACGSEEATLRATSAYLTRVLPERPIDADARITLFVPATGHALGIARPGTPPDSFEGVVGGAFEAVAAESESFDIDIRKAADGYDVDATARLKKRESAIARAAVLATRPSAPQPNFWRLPEDSLVAFDTAGAQPSDLAPLRALVAKAVLVDAPAPVRASVSAALEKAGSLFLTGGPLVFAAGVSAGPDASERLAIAAENATKDKARALTEARTALSPWAIAAMDDAPERWIAAARDLVKLADEEWRREAKSRPAPTWSKESLVITAPDAKWKLPAGTLYFAHKTVAIDKRAKSETVHFLAVPGGKSTWVGVGVDGTNLAARLRQAVDPAGPSASPNSLVAAAKGQSANATFAFTLRNAMLLAEALDESASFRELAELAKTPARGRTPMLLSLTSQADDKPRVTVHCRVPRAMLGDFVRLFH